MQLVPPILFISCNKPQALRGAPSPTRHLAQHLKFAFVLFPSLPCAPPALIMTTGPPQPNTPKNIFNFK